MILSANDLPTVNAALNCLSTLFLVLGFIKIKKGDREGHQKIMKLALLSSSLFLACYLVYHYEVGSVAYPHHDWTRPLYFILLIPHVILAAVMVPFILLMVWQAVKGNFEKHARIARYVWPVWLFVSISGVLVYVMLYRM